jgi:hypothetical protein
VEFQEVPLHFILGIVRDRCRSNLAALKLTAKEIHRK